MFIKHRDHPLVQAVMKFVLGSKLRPLPPGIKYHFFLSHKQANAQGQVMALYKTLQAEFPGMKVWHDMEQLPTDEEMQKGIRESACFLMYMSKGYMERPACQKEVGWALAMGKRFVIVYATDERHGGMSFGEHMAESKKAFPQCAVVFENAVAVKYQAEAELVKAMIKQIMDRSGLLLNPKGDCESPPPIPQVGFQ